MNFEVRSPAVAGSFYPADPKTLDLAVNAYLDPVRLSPGETKRRLRAIAVPHAGYVYSGSVAGQAFTVARSSLSGGIVRLWGPSHRFAFRGLSGNPHLSWKLPGRLIACVRQGEGSTSLAPAGLDARLIHKDEHCLEVELPFVVAINPDSIVDPVLFGDVDPEKALSALLKNDPTLGNDGLIVVSTDLSHYRPDSEARRIDAAYLEAVVEGEVASVAEGEACGRLPLATLVVLADERGWSCRLLTYKTSAETSGDLGRVVGYAALAWFEGD